jgi:hypothetical protein
MISSQHIYEVRPRKDHRGVDLIPSRCLSVGCGMASQPQLAMQLATQSFSAAHITQ